MGNNKCNKSARELGCLVLLALPFAGVDLGMAVLLVWTLADHLAARDWEEVPARLVHAELVVNDDADGDTYRATARYVYSYGGRQYTGTRVSLYSGSDNVGSFQKEAHHELSTHQKSGRPFRCYVDPGNPQNSVLYRRLRWEMIGFYTIFVLMFGGVGFGLLIGGWIGRRRVRAAEAAARDRPEEPWLWKPEWADGRIRSSSKMWMYVAIACAVFWNVVSAPLWFLLPGEVLDKGNRLALLGAVFPVVGIGLLVWAAVAVLRWRRYGESVFEMAEIPGVVGGKLAGVVHTTRKVEPQEGFHVVLSCIRKEASGDETRETVVWSDERGMARELASYDYAKSAIPVLFGIPYDKPPTSDADPKNQVLWRLDISAKVPGIDYAASFDVPVFKTPESRPDFQLDESPISDYVAPASPSRDLARAGVIKTFPPAGAGTRYVFPMARHPGMALGATVFLLTWSGAITLMVHWEAPILFPVVFGLFEVFLVFWVLDLWLYRSVVDVFPGDLAVTGGHLGLGRTRRFHVQQVKKVLLKQGMQSGKTIYYNVLLELDGDKNVVAGKRLKSEHLAKAVVHELETALGRREPQAI